MHIFFIPQHKSLFLTMFLLLAVFLGTPTRAPGQNVSVGIVAGGSPTADFQNEIFRGGGLGFSNYSTPKHYVAGAMVEFKLDSQWSLEVDGLYHPLGYTFAGIEPDGALNSVSPATVVTWEFPILAKYRFSLSGANPFIAAGPSFRTTGNLNSASPSHYGVTAGLGVEMHLRSLAIAPEIRYTRWAADRPSVVQTVSDQIELLVGFSSSTQSNWRPLGNRVAVGAVAGANLTADFHPYTNHLTLVQPPGSFTVDIFQGPGPKSFLGGAMFELFLSRNFALEANVIYESLTSVSRTTVTRTQPSLLPGPSSNSQPEWKFPVLAKYRFQTRILQPLAELGPSFRLPTGNSTFSHYGVTAGVGVEGRVRRLKIAPVFRYTRWASEASPAVAHSNLNQVEFLTGFYF